MTPLYLNCGVDFVLVGIIKGLRLALYNRFYSSGSNRPFFSLCGDLPPFFTKTGDLLCAVVYKSHIYILYLLAFVPPSLPFFLSSFLPPSLPFFLPPFLPPFLPFFPPFLPLFLPPFPLPSLLPSSLSLLTYFLGIYS